MAYNANDWRLNFLLFTRQRVGDVAAMRRSDLRDGTIYIRQQKTGAELVIPLHPKLLRSIKVCPANGLTLIGSPMAGP